MFKFVISLLLLSTIVAAVDDGNLGDIIQGRGIFDINIGKQVDQKLEQLQALVVEKGYDPMDLVNATKDVTVRPVLIPQHGTLYLTKGWLQDLRSLFRSGDAFLTFKLTKANVKIPISFEQLEFGYDYKAAFTLFKLKGEILGNIVDVQMYLEATYDLVRKYAQVKSFQIVDAGKINLKLTGNTLTDIWANSFLRSVTEATHDTIIEQINSTIADNLDLINEKLRPKKLQQ